MAQVRDTRLDEICESIGEGLDGIKTSTEQVEEGKSAAMSRLHSKGLSAYRHAGVRVSLIPGSEKVSVKREKDREVTIAQTAGATNQVADEEQVDDDVDLDGGAGEGDGAGIED